MVVEVHRAIVLPTVPACQPGVTPIQGIPCLKGHNLRVVWGILCLRSSQTAKMVQDGTRATVFNQETIEVLTGNALVPKQASAPPAANGKARFEGACVPTENQASTPLLLMTVSEVQK